jgi:ferredoxin
VPLDGAWVGCCLTERGAALVEGAAPLWPAAGEEDWAAVEEQRRAVEESIGAERLPAEWAGVLAEHFDGELWTVLGERCLRCGLCAYVCPSCSCFDVNDAGNALCGTLCRSWDSCGFAQFTKQAAGHNPRPTQPARYRQRVLHKFAWFPLEHGRFMCVGCGRCVELCPVGLDIRQAVNKVATA